METVFQFLSGIRSSPTGGAADLRRMARRRRFNSFQELEVLQRFRSNLMQPMSQRFNSFQELEVLQPSSSPAPPTGG